MNFVNFCSFAENQLSFLLSHFCVTFKIQEIDDLGEIDGLDDFDFTADGLNETIGENERDEFGSQPFDTSADSQEMLELYFTVEITILGLYLRCPVLP